MDRKINDDRVVNRNSRKLTLFVADEVKGSFKVVTESQNAVTVIESLCQRFMRSCNACPVFLIGSIQDAFESAFKPTIIDERRPLLIYIHHDKSPSINRFCLEMFCGEVIMDYLLEEYIVWPWNITTESNRNILIKIWDEKFSDKFFINFSMEQCPMLIGIMPRSPKKNNPFLPLPYEYKILLIRDTLVHTPRQLNLKTLFDQLVAFKKDFDKNEQYLSLSFVEKTNLPWELVLKIVKYLSLNDAVTVFSMDILPLLRKNKMKLPIIEPSEEFMRTIIQKIKQERVISLRVKADHLRSTMEFPSAIIFTNITSLILDDLQHIKQINEIQTYFPNLTYFSLRCNNEIDFHKSRKVFSQIPNSIKQFEISCDSISCSHHRTDLLFIRINNFNVTIETFKLNVAYTSMSLINNCVQGHNKCALRTITDFIKIMTNIQCVCVIINKGNIETLLDTNEWMGLVNICQRLEKITLKVIRNMSHDTQLEQKIQEIENSLHKIRQSIKFEVKIK